MVPDYWDKACQALSEADPVMAELIARYQGETLRTRGDAFYTLARSIVGQQISVKAADSVWGRYETLLEEVTPLRCLQAEEEALRGCGLSRQKITYLRAIAEHFEHHGVEDGFFDAMDDQEAMNFLIEIKGVGRWTAEMFLMFHLMRPDLLPVDDIGLQRSMEKHYLNGEKINKKQMVEMAKPWQPWRSVATWYLWRALDPVPVAY